MTAVVGVGSKYILKHLIFGLYPTVVGVALIVSYMVMGQDVFNKLSKRLLEWVIEWSGRMCLRFLFHFDSNVIAFHG